jgi:hypothetical protein
MAVIDDLSPEVRRALRVYLDSLRADLSSKFHEIAAKTGLPVESVLLYGLTLGFLAHSSRDQLRLLHQSDCFDGASDDELERAISNLELRIEGELETIRPRNKRKPRISDN